MVFSEDLYAKISFQRQLCGFHVATLDKGLLHAEISELSEKSADTPASNSPLRVLWARRASSSLSDGRVHHQDMALCTKLGVDKYPATSEDSTIVLSASSRIVIANISSAYAVSMRGAKVSRARLTSPWTWTV